MKALVYTDKNTVVFRDEPDPVPGNDEVLVRIDACGVCGSDMHAYHGHDGARRPPPLILGHEASGIVMTGGKAGRRVAINPLVTCGTCTECLDGRVHLCASRVVLSMPARPGAFAEIVRVPEANLVELPAGFDIVKASLAEPVAVSYHAVNRGLRMLNRPASRARCVVLGGGAIGLASALVLAMSGAGEIHIAEPNAKRRETAMKAGSFKVYAPGSAGEPTDSSVDLVIDAVGAGATRSDACRLARPGGTIVHVGLLPGSDGVDVRKLTLQEINFVGTYCYTMVDFRETVAALASGRLGTLSWTEERPLKDGAAAFRDIDTGATAAAKIILRP
ncbi:MAG: alcohol dehydrogenase catalytic domain-containing protein [Hyphomicrobiaceae bacterium]